MFNKLAIFIPRCQSLGMSYTIRVDEACCHSSHPKNPEAVSVRFIVPTGILYHKIVLPKSMRVKNGGVLVLLM